MPQGSHSAHVSSSVEPADIKQVVRGKKGWMVRDAMGRMWFRKYGRNSKWVRFVGPFNVD